MSLKAKNLAPPMSFDFISPALLSDEEELFKFFSEFFDTNYLFIYNKELNKYIDNILVY